jgi:hypothetical protein
MTQTANVCPKSMSVLTDFYLADPQYAKDYDDDQQCAEIDRAQYKGITPLEVSKLLAIVQTKAWAISMMDEFPQVLIVDGGERLIFEIPKPIMERFAALTAAEICSATAAWAKTEELACEAEDVQPVVEEIVRLSKRGLETKRSLYLWICV